MTIVPNVSAVNVQQPLEVLKKENVYSTNFKANSDKFVRQPSMQELQNKHQRDQKKQKIKNDLGWGIGLLASTVMLIFFGKMIFGKGGGPGGFKLSNLKFENLKDSKKLGDLRETKTYVEEVKKFFIDLLDNASLDEKALKQAGFLDEALPNAALVLGPPGVGKTEIIKMFSKALGGEYCEIKLGEVANSYVDGTATQILKMFEDLVTKIKSNPDKNYTIFFDEIDGFARKLESISSNNEYLGKNRQSFIKGLDMLKELKNVRIFGATNVPVTEVDEAVISRLAKNITINLPQKEQALEGLKFHLRNVQVGDFYERQAEELDKFMDMLCEKKCSFRDIGTIVQDARAKFAKEINHTKNYELSFDMKYLENALKEKGLTSGELAGI